MRSSSDESEKIGNNGFPANGESRPVVSVSPLNSVPYIGPSNGYTSSLSTNKSNGNAERVGPAMIFLPAETSQEFNDLVARTKTGVVLTGSAALGQIGHTVGLIDVAQSDDSYYFRVSLPGVSRDEKEFTCDIEPDGKIMIKGVTTTGERTVCRDSQVFTMLTHNMCPPGHFTMSFQLPGPVSNKDFVGNFGSDGVLEGVVKRLYEN
uniref:SHSP domain-containing protein n=1 Tax=Noccaea caerulescens TaxID=107243 RepID=A0A1J3JF22_NOCCA